MASEIQIHPIDGPSSDWKLLHDETILLDKFLSVLLVSCRVRIVRLYLRSRLHFCKVLCAMEAFVFNI